MRKIVGVARGLSRQRSGQRERMDLEDREMPEHQAYPSVRFIDQFLEDRRQHLASGTFEIAVFDDADRGRRRGGSGRAGIGVTVPVWGEVGHRTIHQNNRPSSVDKSTYVSGAGYDRRTMGTDHHDDQEKT